MTLLEISWTYQSSAAALKERIVLLREARKESADPEERRRLEQRERDLAPLLREARELQKLTAHYYDRRYQRSGKYTL